MFLDTTWLNSVSLGKFTLASALAALGVLAVCLLAIRLLMKLINKALAHSRLERSLHTFLRESVRILLYVITALIVADTLGIPVTSLIAVFSVVGLAVSLAVQGTLSNLAGGLLILTSKPFVVGDYVEAGGVGGVVSEIGLVYTKIRTYDNKLIFAPNSDIAAAKIVNYTAQGKRRVDVAVSVPGGADAALVREALAAAAARRTEILPGEPVFLGLTAYGQNSLEYTLRVWTKTGDYWDVYFALLTEVREELDRRGIGMPTPQMQVQPAQQ